jgi:hypothetical protein
LGVGSLLLSSGSILDYVLSTPGTIGSGVNTSGANGSIHGGNGIWDNFTTNFTNLAGTAGQSWQNGMAIFAATPGTVTLGANIIFQGMEFSSDGYAVAGAGAFELDRLEWDQHL